MKGFKKLLTGILAATMIMGASLTAFAAEDTTPETVSITIENDLEEGADGVKKIDYTYYQFLKAEVLELDNDDAEQEGKAVYYVEDEDLATALANTNLFTSTKAQAANRWYIAAVKGVTADQIVAALNTPDMKKLAISTDTFSSDENRKAVKDGLEPGYYLVLSSLGTKAALQTLGDVVIKEKNEDTTVTKTENKNIDAMFDHEVEYTITINVPESPAEQPIMVVDTATVGLTLDETVKVNGEDYDWAKWTKGEEKVNSETQKSEIEYTLSIPKEVVIDNAGGAIVLT
ncbi:MAG: hypothetical protein J6O49_01405, partial [Bacteroidaceae bacterium]|nr:hypothetical protein [Bacteroidaceae bacterium]